MAATPTRYACPLCWAKYETVEAADKCHGRVSLIRCDYCGRHYPSTPGADKQHEAGH